MSVLNYNLQILLNPPSCRRGDRLTVTVKALNPTNRIAKVVITIPRYNISKQIPQVGVDTYSLTMPIPSIVPRGKYEAMIYAVDTEGNKGPVEKVTYDII